MATATGIPTPMPTFAPLEMLFEGEVDAEALAVPETALVEAEVLIGMLLEVDIDVEMDVYA